jgi:hypothetical protein
MKTPKIVIIVILSSLLLQDCAPQSKPMVAVLTTPTQYLAKPPSPTQSIPTPLILSPTSCNHLYVGQSPFTKSIADSHLLYKGLTKDIGWQFWVLSIGDTKLQALNNYPQASGDLGFLNDKQHFIATGFYDVWLGNIDGLPARKIDEINLHDPLLANFRPYSQIWADIVDVADPNPPPDRFDYMNGRFHSPDNKKIAIWKPGDSGLFLLDQASMQQVKAVATGIHDTISGTWTSDSQRFIFAYTHGSPDKFDTQLLEINSDGTELRSLTPPVNQMTYESPVISPDDEKIVFTINQSVYQSFGLLRLNDGSLNIYQLEETPGLFVYGDRTVWSPDSQWFAFVLSNPDRSEEIHITNIESAETYCVSPSIALRNIGMDWH